MPQIYTDKTQIKKFKNSGIEELKDKGREARNKPPGAPLGAASRPDSVGKQETRKRNYSRSKEDQEC